MAELVVARCAVVRSGKKARILRPYLKLVSLPMKSNHRRKKHVLSRAVWAVTTAAAVVMSGCTTQAHTPAAGSQAMQVSAISLDAAIHGSQRSQREMMRDPYRHPKETLQFFELAPTQTVLEIAPGGGWYTEILAPYLRDAGHLYEAQYVSTSAQDAGERSADAAFAHKLASAPAIYGNVVVGTLRAGEFSGFDASGRFDRVLTFRNIHNWLKDGQLDANLRGFYQALKSGGELGVEEHRARPGTTVQQMIDSGYMTEAFVIAHAQAAGFVLAASSEINANPLDTKDYPRGVWALPPTYAGGDTDRARYAAIGESDRMTLRFIKP
jgi:predicted methyltransferase